MSIVPCPYKSLEPTAYWRASVARKAMADVDPITATKFSIGKDDRIATAGSCFAQHISRYMARSGYNYFVSEPGHPILGEDVLRKFNYGTFSARYGNIYTTRQLIQTIERAYGLFEPEDDVWEQDGRFYDPYRPQIQPNGFPTRAEFVRDREEHFASIRRLVEEFDVFVFTLGLTEMWHSTIDGAAYPVCPGCGAGEHDTDRHAFHNLGVDEVVADMERFIAFVGDKNPNGKILLTVSPVPLIATYEPQHVLVSNTFSKSVLRVAAQMLRDRFEHVDYFPSYEIITSNFSGGRYYESDMREVRSQGVDHAMRCFFRHYLGLEIEGEPQAVEQSPPTPARSEPVADASAVSKRINDVICDEEILEQFAD